jgi:KUP system potassium uptake protein
MAHSRNSHTYIFLLTLGALGVVFGDIGTSPLYTLREAFYGPHSLPIDRAHIIGIVSLILWSLIITISIKYLFFILKCDNKGEGGILALMALALPPSQKDLPKNRWMIFCGLFGASLLYGDGMITPAITVTGAIEGLTVATPMFEPYIVPLSIGILACVFYIQHRGTGNIGAVFGPVILLWFIVIALLGIRGILLEPSILHAINPYYGILFLVTNGYLGFITLGIVFLAVTGGEALYADMGHFGRLPIRIGWYAVVLPALVLNYFGQGALLLSNPQFASNPFFYLAPQWALYPLVCLATAAAVIASQALISGAFSITRQAVSLGFLPRMFISHTSKEEIGQIYVPLVNWLLFFSTIGLILYFQKSSAMASAYGIAVTTTMVLTTLLAYTVTRQKWKWPRYKSLMLITPLLIVDLAFFSASMTKVLHGGFFTVLVGIMILLVMSTWQKGRAILAQRMKANSIEIVEFIKHVEQVSPIRVPGTAVFMTSTTDIAPAALVANLKHNCVLHEHVILMTISIRETPYVAREERYTISRLPYGIIILRVFYGFMDTFNVPAVLMRVALQDLPLNETSITYFMGRETVLATHRPGMPLWQEKLFAFMARNAQRATAYFKIPSHRVIEIGIHVEL